MLASDLANGRNSSWGTYAAKTLAGAVTGAVMRNFGGALGSLWPASGTLARAGLAGATYGMMFRKNDQFFGEVFGLEGYRERDFWEKVWYVFSPARAARDGGLAALLQSVISGPVGSPEPEAQAGAEGLMLPGSRPEANALVPGGDVSQAGVEGAGQPLNSVDDIVKNPQSLYGKSKSDVLEILGDGWTEGVYGSNKTGWKFTRGDQSVFYHPGGGIHGGSYYGYSSAATGKIKIVGPDYIPLPGDKATIINVKQEM